MEDPTQRLLYDRVRRHVGDPDLSDAEIMTAEHHARISRDHKHAPRILADWVIELRQMPEPIVTYGTDSTDEYDTLAEITVQEDGIPELRTVVVDKRPGR